MQEPAKQAGLPFTTDAGAKLIHDLRTVLVQDADGSMRKRPGLYVEPVQLQVVCHRLWNHLPPGINAIQDSHVQKSGDVNAALSGYYADSVAAAAQHTSVPERAIREWFDRHLITEQGIRGQVLRGADESQGLPNTAIVPLVDAHLVRAENRRGATWYELAHDRLIEPVRSDNAVWFEANLSPLQRQAELWEKQRRSKGFLLREEALETAEQWAQEHPDDLLAREREFLKACREARAIALRERRQARRIFRLAVVSMLIAIVALIALVFAVRQQRVAETERNRAQGLEQERTRDLFESYLTTASLLARNEDYAAAGTLLNTSRELDGKIEPQRRHARNAMAWFTDLMGEAPAQTYSGTDTSLFNVALSPDGDLVAAAGSNGIVALFNANSGELLTRWQGHADSVWQMAFHPSEPWLLTAGQDGRILFWAYPEARKLREWDAQRPLRAIAFSPDGMLLAGGGIGPQEGGETHQITVWDVETGNIRSILPGHADRISIGGLAFSPDGALLASASRGATAKIWDIRTGEVQHTLEGHLKGLNALAFHREGRFLATSSDDRRIRLWDVRSGAALPVELIGHTNEVYGLRFLNADQLISTSSDRTLRIWDWRSGVTLNILQGHAASVNSVASLHGQAFSVSNDQTIMRWDIQHSAMRRNVQTVDLPTGVQPTSCALAPDGTGLAVGFATGELRTYALPDMQLRGEWEHAHSYGIYGVAFSPDSQSIASASFDRTIKLWRIGAAQPQHTVTGHTLGVRQVAFTPDGTRLISASDDGSIGIFVIGSDSGQFYPAHAGEVWSADVSPDGQRLVTTGADKTLCVWDLATESPTPLMTADFQKTMFWAAFSPDQRRIAAVGQDNLVHVLNLSDDGHLDGEQTPPLAGHERTIYRALFSPDSQQIVTISTDLTVRFWDLAAGTELFTLRLPESLESGRQALLDFDFRCHDNGTCRIAVPLTRGKLVLYTLEAVYQ